MNFATFWQELNPAGREVFARAVGATPFYLYLIAKGHKKPGPKTAIRIEEASGGKVNRSQLRSDLWPTDKAAA